MNSCRRIGVTMLEVLIVIAIMVLMATLSMVAVSRIREASARAESMNNLRQIVLAVHHHADKRNGRLPTVGDIVPDQVNPYVLMPMIPSQALFVRILPYIEQNHRRKSVFPPVKLYISPADPTARPNVAKGNAVSSYASNGQVFMKPAILPGSFADGMSNTIAFGEHYSQCDHVTFFYWQSSIVARRASFADYGNIAPATTGNPPVSGDPDFPLLTYQVAPRVSRCNPSLAQTPHSSGMLIAMVDGTVRQISPNISPSTYWALVTPAAGDTPGSD